MADAVQTPEIRRNLGKRIRTLRRLRGLSQQELGLIAGLNRTYLAGVENGKRNITIDSLAKVAHGLEVSLAALLEDVEDGDVSYAYIRLPDGD